MARLLAELKRRNVFKVATIYVVVGWLVLQVASTVFPLFEIPLWASRLVVVLLGLGFPVALVLAWAFDLTPEGIEWESTRGEKHVHTHAWDWVLAVLLVVAIGFVLISEIRNWSESGAHLSEQASKIGDSPATGDGGSMELSIAVLPFVNMSGDPDNEYFSDGLSEEILNLLAKIPGLKVIGRTSSFAFKGKNEDLRVIGDTLGVSSLLEGSVRKSGERLRITAQLVGSADGAHIWSETYERTVTDIFAVQDDVAAKIINALQIHVGANPTRGRPTENSNAYVLFLKAKTAANSYKWRNAEALLFQAIELDPGFAEAYELLAYSYWRMAGVENNAAESQRLTGEAAAKALAIDPNLVFAKALNRIGNVETYSLLEEIEAFELAALERPDNQEILDTLFFNLFKAGYLQEALAIAQRNVELDPLSPVANGRMPAALFAVGRTADAFAALEVLEQMSIDRQNWYVGEVNLANKRDRIAITRFEDDLTLHGIVDMTWVADLVAGARDPTTGQAYLDRRIPQITASMPEQLPFDMQQRLRQWYLFFGFLDRYFEFIFEHDLTKSTWSDVDNLITAGIGHPQLGFAAHPKYLRVADMLGMIDVWEQRGPPDFCEKSGSDWICD